MLCQRTVATSLEKNVSTSTCTIIYKVLVNLYEIPFSARALLALHPGYLSRWSVPVETKHLSIQIKGALLNGNFYNNIVKV